MADKIVERDSGYGVFWAALAIVVLLVVAWFLFSSLRGAPGVPATGPSVDVTVPAPTPAPAQ